ncbi:hypothetical protein OB13_14555 [Pontibacter sp. HJ8]
MILHQTSLIKLDYNPATDILQAEYPDLDRLHLPEIKHNFSVMVEVIRNYDVKKLLLDASQTDVSLNDEENRQLGLELAAELSKTRLQKLARIQPRDPGQEIKAQVNINLMKQSGLLPYELETFSNRAQAIAWLLQ